MNVSLENFHSHLIIFVHFTGKKESIKRTLLSSSIVQQLQSEMLDLS